MKFWTRYSWGFLVILQNLVAFEVKYCKVAVSNFYVLCVYMRIAMYTKFL